jgi:hypothetical protein
MQIPFVMMLALAGLGCQNKSSVVVDAGPLTGSQVESAPPASDQRSGYSTRTYSGSFAPTPYPDIPSRLYTNNSEPRSTNWHAELRSTLCSFVIGRDPDVSTAREIEASVYGMDSGR